ncbi:MAG: hypothetical protein ABI624_16835 [Casimicrobiaceae bacterium]
MQISEVPPVAAGKPGAVLRRTWLIFLIIAGVLYCATWAWELHEYFSTEGDAKIEENRKRYGSFVESMRAGVQHRLDQLKAVDADALVNVYFRTMQTTDCDWLFQCTPLYHQERLGYTGPRTPVAAADSQLFYHPGWILYVPTSRTVRGTPHALVETATAIRRSGGWAVAMFASCTAIWGVLVLAAIKSRSENEGPGKPLVVYLMVLAAPFAIALMVSAVQWVAERALEKVGGGMGLLVEVLAHSTALALIVGIPHILRSPRELREAAETLKHLA